MCLGMCQHLIFKALMVRSAACYRLGLRLAFFTKKSNTEPKKPEPKGKKTEPARTGKNRESKTSTVNGF